MLIKKIKIHSPRKFMCDFDVQIALLFNEKILLAPNEEASMVSGRLLHHFTMKKEDLEAFQQMVQ